MLIDENNQVSVLFNKLSQHYGNQHWWPSTTAFEMAVGAILTQSTNWNNASQALANLSRINMLSPSVIHYMPHDQLSEIIRPSGYHNIKASRLKTFASHIYSSYGNDFEAYLNQPIDLLREDLLSIKGIGKETADAIILSGGEQAIFIIEEYTKRLFSRFGEGPSNNLYDDWQNFFHFSIPSATSVYGEYHSIIIAHGKAVCKKIPKCHICFLVAECKTGKETLTKSSTHSMPLAKASK